MVKIMNPRPHVLIPGFPIQACKIAGAGFALRISVVAHVQSGAEISGRTRVYHNQAGPG